MISIRYFKSLLSLRNKLYIKYFLSKKTNEYMHLKNKKKIIITLAADYGNLGDVAITYAQTKFLEKSYPEYEIIDFPISNTFTNMKSLKKVINSQDIITIVGGGNTGDMYDDIEYCRQFVISSFPNNKIICFPQTIDFSNTQEGIKARNKAIKVYGRHKNLTLSAREENSFETFKKYFNKNKINFAPDIVLSLDESLPQKQREGITFCLRSDSEKKLEKKAEEELIKKISLNNVVRFQDTHIEKKKMSVGEREEELNKVWSIFKKSELVITDRLHGMIFCAITNTPCIAIDNINKKISGVYNAWLKENKNINVVEHNDVDIIIQYVKNMDNNIDSSTINFHLFEKITN